MTKAPEKTSPFTGNYSPLRYPGGKGKLAKFVSEIIHSNLIQDGLYVEPYAGGAAVAWELILTGTVRRIHINDLSLAIYAFWHSVLERTDELCSLIFDTAVNLEVWAKMKWIFSNPKDVDLLELGFATFYLNRTNRSGILNGGPIGGRMQTGLWNIDARYNKCDLVKRIERIAVLKRRVSAY